MIKINAPRLSNSREARRVVNAVLAYNLDVGKSGGFCLSAMEIDKINIEVTGWQSPDVHYGDYSEAPASPGLYYIAIYEESRRKIVDIGKSSNLAKRNLGHSKKGECKKLFNQKAMFFFKEFDISIIDELERKFIQAYRPILNKQLVK